MARSATEEAVAFAAEAKKEADLADRLERERADALRRRDAAELKKLVSAENHRQDVLRLVKDFVVMAEPPKYTPPSKTGTKRLPHHTWGALLSDWQMGQLNTNQGTGGLFEQTTAITKEQVRLYWSLIEQQHRIQNSGKVVDELVYFSLGDLVENDQMRASQAGEIDTLVTQQAVDALDLEAWLLTQALATFPKVRMLHVGGNHDRTSPKAGSAGLGELGFTDTYSWLIGAVLQRMFERAIDSGRLEIVNHESFFGTAIVAGQRCVYEHGASFKASTGSYGGVSYYSIASAAAKYQAMLDGADMVLMGHHHRAMVLPMNGGFGWQIMNGALPPSSSFIQSNFKSVGRPTQILLDLHADRGLVGWSPLYLDTKHQLRPGQFWRGVKGSAA
jgi:predicted phosphodiesterase